MSITVPVVPILELVPQFVTVQLTTMKESMKIYLVVNVTIGVLTVLKDHTTVPPVQKTLTDLPSQIVSVT
jgi:hypothetical protein